MVKNFEKKLLDKFSIVYLDRNESMFVLGLLRSVPCSHCPDFYKGCSGGGSLQETAMISEKDFIEKHINGTEEFLCGKLRNILSLSKAEEQELHNKFEENFNRKISILTKRNDDKYVLISDKDEFENISKTIEQKFLEKFKHEFEKINTHNISVVKEMQEKIAFQEDVIQNMQLMIETLKESKL